MVNWGSQEALLTFQSISEAQPGDRWRSLFESYWPAYERWFLSEGVEARQTYLAGYRALKKHMPELVPTYDALVELVGGGDMAARFLSYYCPPPYLSGCSQAVKAGDEPLLVRNYDYSPALSDAVILNSRWNDRWVTGMTDGLFGLVDGMNEAGLAVSLTFGGRTIVGDGFGVPIIIRYVLEFCRTTQEAVRALKRIPCHMAYNVTVVDKNGRYNTVYMSPDRGAMVTDQPVATNHQEQVEWHRHARATATVERERFLLQRLTLHDEPSDRFIAAFQKPPLYSLAYDRGFGTLYTAVYWPARGTIEYRWPGEVWSHEVTNPSIGVRTIKFPVGAMLA